jgi:anti-sigma factor RsiW
MNGDQDSELSGAVKRFATRYEAPPSLRERVTTAVRAAELRQPTAVREAPPRAFWWQWATMGAVFASGVVVAWTLTWFLAAQGEFAQLSDDLVANHVRSLMVAHLTDVASSDQHTVKPWFSGKLDYTPPVRDLTQEGFPLVGGRLDYLDGRSVAALVYRRRLHTINLFVWPCDDTMGSGIKRLTRRGYNIVSWCDGGMQFWAVSDLSAEEMQTFGQLLRQTAETQFQKPMASGSNGNP